jgi:Spy/CpxP family protein refolding chaperone
MFRATFLRCLVIALALVFVSSSMWAQTGSKKPTTQNAAAKKFRGRLPNNYGRIGLDTKQREAIYAIQEKYHTEKEELEARLAEIKVKEGEEILAVLTAEQQTALKALQSKTKTAGKATDATTTAPEE